MGRRKGLRTESIKVVQCVAVLQSYRAAVENRLTSCDLRAKIFR